MTKTNFSAKAYLSEVHGISTKGKGKVNCPFCSHGTMSVAKNDQLAKCFHPTCGRFISPQALDGDKNPVQGFLWELVGNLKREILRQGENPDDHYSFAWQYLTNERKIHPQVIQESLVGTVPQELNLDTMAAPFREKLERLLEKGIVDKKRKERLEQAISNFDEMLEKLKEVTHPGNLAFIYTGSKNEITSIRFREPFSKRFSWFKPFPKCGVFNPQLDPTKDATLEPYILLVEGEINILMLQSTLLKAGQSYQPCIALGSSSAVDWGTLKTYKGKWLLFQDHDEAGDYLALEMQQHRTFWVTQASLPDSDLDSFLRGYGSPHEALIALQQLTMEAKARYRFLSAITVELHGIRKNETKLKEFEVNQRASKLVIGEMRDRGTFYKTKLALYYFDNEKCQLMLIHKESQSLLHLLHQLGLNPIEAIHGYILKELLNEAFRNGKLTEVHDLLHYEKATNTLYWANGNQAILKITTSMIESVPNGTDGFLFVENNKYEPFTQVPFDLGRDYLAELLLDQINFNEEYLLTPDEQKTVLKFYFLSLFFPTLMKTRPILCPVADKGSGKTSLLRRIGRLLIGKGFDVTPLPEKQQDFQVALANHHFLAFDNVDERSKWLNDTLAICATGGTIRMRTLYTTAEETEIQIKSFLALNSRTPNYRRDDVADRLLLLSLKPWGAEKRPESDLNRELLETRNAFLSDLIPELQNILKALASVPGEGFQTNFRMADFASFCYRIAKYQGNEDELIKLLEKLSDSQSQFTLEMDSLFECLTLFVEEYPNYWMDTKTLHQKLLILAENLKIPYHIKNAKSLGRQLQRLKPNIERFMVIETERRSGNVTWYRFDKKLEKPL